VEDLDQLVAAARSGGGWAFGRLWEQLAPAVAAYLRSRGVRDADDVTSEVFLAAFRGIARFQGDGAAFRSWLFTIAHHKGVDALRRPASREVLVDAVGGGGANELARGCSERSAEDVAMDRIGADGALRRLATLTDDQRAVLLLRVVADLSLAETAEVLDKPVGAVKSLQHRALARLRAALADEDQAVSPDVSNAMGRVT
jgi:RNA polymerase sigma-70 factor, ECF subfamily